jgi:uncharacterized protein YndB with AHSA1/START domain
VIDMSNPTNQMTVRELCQTVVVPAGVADVWRAWTTEEGVVTFFAPRAVIRLEVNGPYELLFDLDGPQGSQGSEGCQVLGFELLQWLTFSWSFPRSSPLHGELTQVGVSLVRQTDTRTRVVLAHRGWRSGPTWDEGFRYFQRAWRIVLGRLVHRFEVGPIDWQDPFTPP